MYDNFTYIKTASAIPRAAAMIEENVAAGNIELSDDELLALQKEFPSPNKKVPLAVI